MPERVGAGVEMVATRSAVAIRCNRRDIKENIARIRGRWFPIEFEAPRRRRAGLSAATGMGDVLESLHTGAPVRTNVPIVADHLCEEISGIEAAGLHIGLGRNAGRRLKSPALLPGIGNGNYDVLTGSRRICVTAIQ